MQTVAAGATISPSIPSINERVWDFQTRLLFYLVAISFLFMFGLKPPVLGVHILTLTLFFGLFSLPVHLSAISVAYGVLLAGTYGGLTPTFVTQVRWGLILISGAVFILRFSALSGKSQRRETTLFQRLMQCFTLAAGLSVFVSESMAVSASKFVPLLALVVVCSVASNRIAESSGSQSARRVVISWLILLSPVYLFNFLSLFTGGFWNTGTAWSVGSFRGIAGNSNTLGAFLAFTLPFLLSIVVWERHRLNLKLQALTLVAFGLIGLLYVTRSRASALAFIAAAVTIQLVHSKSRMPRFAIVGGVFALCYVAANPSIVENVYETWLFKGKSEQGLLTSRVEQWRQSYAIFETHPWLGYGFGVTSSKEGEWNIEQSRAQKAERGSSLLAVLSQVGLVGGIPLYVGLVMILIRGFHFAFRVKDAYFTAILASCVGAFVNSFFEGWLVSPGNGLLWLFLSQIYLLDAVMSRFRPPGVKPAQQPRRPMRLPMRPPQMVPIVRAAP